MTAKSADGHVLPPPVVPGLSSARLHTIIAGLWFCLFISALDTTIVTTALIKISSSFNALEQAAWLVTTYLLTYNSEYQEHSVINSLLTETRLSNDHCEAQRCVGSEDYFTCVCCHLPGLFDGMRSSPNDDSIVCRHERSRNGILISFRIVFRAFQGIGGSGLYSLTFVSILKLVVPEKIGFYSGVISSVFTMSNLLGPLLGGVIADRTTWRWIFFMKYVSTHD